VKIPLPFPKNRRKWPSKTVKFVHVALGLVPEILNPIDVIILFYKEFGVVSPKAMGNCYDQKRCSRATFALPIYL
jgi:hypothetical protein